MNTTVIVMNDALDFIKDDKSFGKNLYDAIRSQYCQEKTVDVPAYFGKNGVYCNAATVIEQHHSSMYIPILVGGNLGQVIDNPENERHIEAVRYLADKLGYRLVKKRKSK